MYILKEVIFDIFQSPRWLMAMGKRSEAEAIIRKAAKVKRLAPGHSLMTSQINHFRFRALNIDFALL
jgi:hypothetical protein